jgi:outer membrane protein TolC
MSHLETIKRLKQMWRDLYFVIKEPGKEHRYLDDENLIYLRCSVVSKDLNKYIINILSFSEIFYNLPKIIYTYASLWKNYFTIFILIFFCLSSLSIAEEYNYEDIVKLAVKNSPAIKVKVYDVEISTINYKQAFAYIFPQTSIGSRIEKYDNLANKTNFITVGGQVIGGQPDERRASIYLSGEYYLSNLYKKLPEIDYYKILKDYSIFDCQATLKGLIKDIIDSYSALIEAKTKIYYSNLLLEQLKEIYNLKKLMYEKGEISNEELLKTEAELESLLKEQTELKRQFNLALLRISELTGRKFSNEDDFKEVALKSNLNFDKPELETLPEFKAQIKQKEALEQRVRIAKLSFLPDLVLYTRYDLYGSSYYSFRESLNRVRQTAFTAGIFLNMTIFDGGRLYWEQKKTLLELRKQEERLRHIKQEKYREIESLYTSYKELQNTIKKYENLIKYYQKILDIENKAFTLGEKSKLDVLETKKEIISLQRDRKITENSLANLEKKLEIELTGDNVYGNYCIIKH